ncbi:amino acid adenylation domain-containing protein [Helicobacter brantae]|uniref:AMP-dependent synthetase/ligase domain-containing protein n=1 Tax=Helicobacter brantae TaxID=375927 RepID=A0A3D8J5H0_9HELI|nr:amino acid adenylation domain-containing protein [Helicobacter brantae]RDU72144.1 hypothetical protein CQA58_00635 [Helicobacter brantae]
MKINVLDYFEETKNLYPQKIALIDRDTQLTFEQMWDMALNISSNLIPLLSRQTQPQVIAVFLPKSHQALLSFFGILMSGNIYMPLDVKSPMERTKAILQNIKPALIISSDEYAAELQETYLDFSALLSSPSKTQTNYQNLISTDPAYIINTSGSTGVPKGVIVSHRNIIDYLTFFKTEPLILPTNKNIIGSQSPFYFDNSVLDIYSMLFFGSTLVLISEDSFSFPKYLYEIIKKYSIDFIFWVPTALKTLSQIQEKLEISKILFAGEAMSPILLKKLQELFPCSTFANLYGPTEITVDCSYYLVNREFGENEMVPIGKACKNSSILLLDEENRVSNRGEICIRGEGVSLGYYNDPQKTSEVFIQNPTHNLYRDIIYKTGDLGYYNDLGELIITGRKDSQIKHNGYRIELGEIEHALLGLDGLDEFCIIYQDEIILATSNENISKADVFKHLKNKIPKYMFPTKVFYTPIPLNRNGKIDRKAVLHQYRQEEK